jgi:hypothetical protein
MFGALRRWLGLSRRASEPACVAREARQRQELEARVDEQLAELIGYLDKLTTEPTDDRREAS